MSNHQVHKPSVEEWLRWGNVVIDRLTNCVHVYKKPPHTDIFMADAERQSKIDKTIKLLHRIHALVDTSETPTDSIPEVHVHDERTIVGLSVIFTETLVALPQLSTDMQKLLKSPWMSQFPNRTAETIFKGEHREEAEGIGSGHPEHGRLPATLVSILEREQIGDNRFPREDLLHQGEPRRRDVEARTRWTEQNSRFLRTVGRVE